MPLLGYLLSPDGLDWLDVPLAAAGLLAVYALLAIPFPQLLRPLWWVAARVLSRFSVYGREHVPASGGCLVVCNHVSYVDWLVLWAASPRTPTFVLWSGYYRNPLLAFFLLFTRRNALRIDNRTAPLRVPSSDAARRPASRVRPAPPAAPVPPRSRTSAPRPLPAPAGCRDRSRSPAAPSGRIRSPPPVRVPASRQPSPPASRPPWPSP